MTYTATGLPSGLSMASDGVVTGTPDGSAGDSTVVVTASAAASAGVHQAAVDVADSGVTLTVGAAPQLPVPVIAWADAPSQVADPRRHGWHGLQLRLEDPQAGHGDARAPL